MRDLRSMCYRCGNRDTQQTWMGDVDVRTCTECGCIVHHHPAIDLADFIEPEPADTFCNDNHEDRA